MHIYANDNRDHFPQVGTADKGNGGFGRGLYQAGNTRWFDPEFRDWDNQATPGGCLYLLVKYADMTPDSFICPSTQDKPMDFEEAKKFCAALDWREPRDWTSLNDFPDLTHLSYSYCDIWSNPLTINSSAKLPILADKNPVYDTPDGSRRAELGSKPDLKLGNNADFSKTNSNNHNREMNVVLFLMGNVKQADSPLVGIGDDNIYTAWEKTEGVAEDDRKIGRWDLLHAVDPEDSYLGN